MQRVHLSCFDEEGLGSLTEAQLEGYISQLVPELPALQGLTSAISLAEYCRIASRKFMFFHARRHRCCCSRHCGNVLWSVSSHAACGAHRSTAAMQRGHQAIRQPMVLASALLWRACQAS